MVTDPIAGEILMHVCFTSVPVERRRKSAGYTVIELMTVLTIVCILLAVAVPSFHSMIQNQKMATTVNDFFAAVNLTRSEAIHRGMRVDLVPAGNGTDWTHGWVVLVDINGNQKADPGEQIIYSHAAVDSDMSIRGAFTDKKAQYLAYTGNGRTRTNGNSQTPQVGSWSFVLDNQSRRIVVNFLGRPRVCKPNAMGASC